MTNQGIRLGVDVGGTNTDAVLIRGQQVLATTKQATSRDIHQGIQTAVTRVLFESGLRACDISHCMIGTTQFTNAFVQGRELNDVAVIRLGSPAAKALPPLTGWPEAMKNSFKQHVFMLPGGHHYDGGINSNFDEKAFAEVIASISGQQLPAVAISSVFSPINNEFELKARNLLTREIPGLAVSLSHEIGKVGIIERENSTIMNACLATLATRVIDAFESSLAVLGITAPLYITQNDGTLLSADQVRRFPVLTFASGPTNSMRGAAFLSGYQQAVVADIGGTTTDIGMLQAGFPRESSLPVDIGGVRTNFRMPDIIAVGLGGGSICTLPGGTVGPESVGYRLMQEAKSFGGNQLTTTDWALSSRLCDISGASPDLAGLSGADIELLGNTIQQLIGHGIDEIKTSRTPLPLILVGGGHFLVQQTPAGISEVIRPPHAEVANAIGASIGQVSGELDRIFHYDNQSRESALEEAKQGAMSAAIDAGALPHTVSVLDIQEIPLSYVKGQATRIRIRATGQLFEGDLQ